MPRLSPRSLHQAKNIDGLLPLVLLPTRDLTAAQNELRWLKEYAISHVSGRGHLRQHRLLERLCKERSRGRPLQYILGSEYFGDLEITCRPGVLIPRQETAASVMHLVRKLTSPPKPLRVLDLCTGSGCIPLLFHHVFRELHPDNQKLQILGVDLSSKAVHLAKHNRDRLRREYGFSDDVEFAQADVLVGEDPSVSRIPSLTKFLGDEVRGDARLQWDILISNPPYISPRHFNHTTARSVRNFEPRLALVPDEEHHVQGIDLGDVFYPRLLHIAELVKSKIVLFEVADMEQAQRVASMIEDQGSWEGVEIWRDDPSRSEQNDISRPYDQMAKVVGCGNGRSVFAWRGDASLWLSR